MNRSSTSQEPEPLVSVVMANHDGAPFLAAAIASVLKQTHRRLELIVVDDASSDNSLAILRDLAANDRRLRVLALPHNRGPAAARNAALDLAQGEWIAIVDADDLIAPDRLRQLLALAAEQQAQIIADDLSFFVAGSPPHANLLGALALRGPTAITPEMLITGQGSRGARVQLGYLKPLLRRDCLGQQRYDERLRIGEDFELLLRLVLGGARLCVTPRSFYHYRRHTASISHRLSTAAARAMLDSHDALARRYGSAPAPLRAAFAHRRRGLEHQLAFQCLVDAIKARIWLVVVRSLLRRPGLFFELARSLRERQARRQPPRTPRRLPS